ncbi:MAG: hypothetical protein IPK46_15895 [Saprospiraceae bacterium]|nr:hypothetical protein [Saprospiraceae bacterium]
MRINAITIAITMVLATASLAAKTPTFLKSNDSRSIILHLNAWKSDKIVVSIKDMAGVTVFLKKFRTQAETVNTICQDLPRANMVLW